MQEAAQSMAASFLFGILDHVSRIFDKIEGVMGRRGQDFPAASLRNPFKTYSRYGILPISGSFPPKEIWAKHIPDKYVLAVVPANPSL